MRDWMLVGAYACIIVAMALIIWDIWDRRRNMSLPLIRKLFLDTSYIASRRFPRLGVFPLEI